MYVSITSVTNMAFQEKITILMCNSTIKKIPKGEQSNCDAAISQIDWSDLLSNEDPESAYRTFLSAIDKEISTKAKTGNFSSMAQRGPLEADERT